MRKGPTLLVLAALAAGCAHQPDVATRSTVDTLCRADDLASCEAGLAAALRAAGETDALAKSYVAARAASLGDEDPWVMLHEALVQAGPGASVAMAEPGGRAALEAGLRAAAAKYGDPAANLVVVETPKRPPLGKLSHEEMALALTRLAGAEQLSYVQDGRVVRVLGVDRLAPLAFDFPPILIQPVEASGPEAFHAVTAKGMRMDTLVNEALEYLAKGSYREAAALAVQLDAMLDAEQQESASALRAHVLVRRARSFGTEFPKPAETETEAEPDEPPLWDRGNSDQGAYAAWLRVLMAGNDTAKAWARHRSTAAAALSPERLELVDRLWGYDPVSGERRCEVEKQPMPAAAWSGDLLFANRLAYLAKLGEISPAEWTRAYEAIVKQVERDGTAWAAVPSLLYERGELPGMSARGSTTYQRVTQLTVSHLRALERFQKTAPDKYGPSGQLTVALQPGALADPAVTQVLQRLVEDNVKYKLAPAATAEELLGTTVVLGLMGTMLPDPIRGAYLGSLRTGLDQKLRDGFTRQAGWEVAALYALNATGAYLLGEQPDLSFAGDNITRALEGDPDIAVRPIALITARGVHYGTLVAQGELEPEQVGNAKVGPGRKAARERLRTALRDMADDPNAVPRASLDRLTTLIDGLIATTVLMVERAPKEESADACSDVPSARELPEVRRNLRALRASRDALVRDPALRDGKTVWAKRAALLAVLASDILDVLQAPSSGTPSFSVPAERARSMVATALSEWTSAETAAGIAALHALARDVSAQEDEWQEALDARRDDLGKVLIGTADLIGATEGSSLAKFVVREGARVLSAPDAESVSDVAPKIVQVAETLFAAKREDQGTVALLVAGALGSDDAKVMGDALGVASRHDSEAAWYLATRRAVRTTTVGSPLEADLLAQGLRAMTDDVCKVAQVEPLVRVGNAVRQYGRGEGKPATDTLDDVLDAAERDGLVVPRVQYQLDEVLESGRTFRLTMHMTAGQGFISENSFQVGFDIFSSKPTSGLKVEIPAAVPEDAGRYYAHVASLAAVYHLLDARDAAAAHDAERMFNALAHGVRLGDTTVIATEPTRWLGDLSTNIHVAAELAARRGHVLLAGELWGLAYGSTTKRAVGEAFEPPSAGWDEKHAPVGLQAVAAVSELRDQVRINKEAIGRAATCDPKARPSSPTNLDTCEAFRRAVALWRAGVYDAPPAMRAGAKESCVREATLLSVVQDLAGPAGQPLEPRVQDKVARTIANTAQSGYLFDALTMLRTVRQRGVCIPALVETARKLGRLPTVTPHGRVDWIGYTLTCPGRQADETVWDDLRLMAAASRKIADPDVPYRIHTAVVRYMVNLQAWDKLAEFSRDAGFVRLMNQGGPGGAAMALLIRHTADVLAGDKPDLAETQDVYDVACIRYGNAGREVVCRELGTLRNRVAREPGTDLKPGAEQLLRQVVGL